MATSIPFTKIYIDSRYATKDSVSSSNFKVELPITCQMPDNTVFFVTDVCIPHSWLTVEHGFNDQLYLTLLDTTTGTYNAYVLTLTANNYTVTTFIAELQRVFNLTPATFSVTADVNNGASIYNTDSRYKFKILTDDDLLNNRYWNAPAVDPNNINSANEIINNTVSTNTLNEQKYPFKTGFLSLNWVNNIYISSPNLGSFNTIFAGKGDTNIIKKVPVTVNYGYMVIDQYMSTNDFLDCSKQTLQTLEFHLKTGKGVYLPLHGSHVSFSLVFNKYNPNV